MKKTNRKESKTIIGHRGVDPTGETTYKKTTSSALRGAIQLGVTHTVGQLSKDPERDILVGDFEVSETIFFPARGSYLTPSHGHSDFKFTTYAPMAFRYFRDTFAIQSSDYLHSLFNKPLIELANPGASGSLFYVSSDDKFIIKTVQHKEAEFLQRLLPGYYLNLSQNRQTLLPKFYGLYCVQMGVKKIRFVVMNNLIPSGVRMHLKYDLKGSSYNRTASAKERTKVNPTFKDLDFVMDMPDGLLMKPEHYSALCRSIQSDCLVLQSFDIMDYSLLVGVHNEDLATHEQAKTEFEATTKEERVQSQRAIAKANARRGRMGEMGGIQAKNSRGERLVVFVGIIDILQSYTIAKKLEHYYKAVVYDGNTVSVSKPSFYSERFQSFMCKSVFRPICQPKGPTSKKGRVGFVVPPSTANTPSPSVNVWPVGPSPGDRSVAIPTPVPGGTPGPRQGARLVRPVTDTSPGSHVDVVTHPSVQIRPVHIGPKRPNAMAPVVSGLRPSPVVVVRTDAEIYEDDQEENEERHRHQPSAKLKELQYLAQLMSVKESSTPFGEVRMEDKTKVKTSDVLLKSRPDCDVCRQEAEAEAELNAVSPGTIPTKVQPSEMEVKQPAETSVKVEPSEMEVKRPAPTPAKMEPTDIEVKRPTSTSIRVEPSGVEVKRPTTSIRVELSGVEIKRPATTSIRADPPDADIKRSATTSIRADPPDADIKRSATTSIRADPPDADIKRSVTTSIRADPPDADIKRSVTTSIRADPPDADIKRSATTSIRADPPDADIKWSVTTSKIGPPEVEAKRSVTTLSPPDVEVIQPVAAPSPKRRLKEPDLLRLGPSEAEVRLRPSDMELKWPSVWKIKEFFEKIDQVGPRERGLHSPTESLPPYRMPPRSDVRPGGDQAEDDKEDVEERRTVTDSPEALPFFGPLPEPVRHVEEVMAREKDGSGDTAVRDKDRSASSSEMTTGDKDRSASSGTTWSISTCLPSALTPSPRLPPGAPPLPPVGMLTAFTPSHAPPTTHPPSDGLPPTVAPATIRPPPPPPRPSTTVQAQRSYTPALAGRCPTLTMKKLNWIKIQNTFDDRCMWVLTDKVPPVSFDHQSMEQMFCFPAAESKDKVQVTPAPVKEITFVEPNKNFNLSIFLKHFKCTKDDFIAMIQNGDHRGMFDVEVLKQLLKLLPEKHEIENLKSFQGDKDKLAYVDRFYYSLLRIPCYQLRIECMLLCEETKEVLKMIKPQAQLVEDACYTIRNSVRLQTFCKLILDVGNFLNHGSQIGNAFGFKISSLPKLADTKANKSQITLLHHILEEVEERQPDLLSLKDDIEICDRAAGVDLKHSQVEVGVLLKRLQDTAKEIANSVHEVVDQYTNVIEESLQWCRNLEERFSEIDRKRTELAVYLCEEANQLSLPELFGTIKTFRRLFIRALRENKIRKEKEELKAMKPF